MSSNRYFNYAKRCIKNPWLIFSALGGMGLLNWLPDSLYLKGWFRATLGRRLNLKNPKTLNEKLQYLKIHDHNQKYTTLVDKYEVKNYIAKTIGREYVVDCYGAWNQFEDINFDLLPDKFVLKCTHDSSKIVVCNDKASFDYNAARLRFNKNLKINYYWEGREWPYKNIKPRIIAEKLLINSDGTPIADYKFYCYGGKPCYFMYSIGEAEHNVRNHKFNMNLESIDHLFKKTPTINLNEIHLPNNINMMIEIVQKLCVGYQHVRIDLYNVDSHIYFGEITFYSGSGIINIDSNEYSRYLANLIDINKVM